LMSRIEDAGFHLSIGMQSYIRTRARNGLR
jgi:hypothetical protein